MRTCSGRWLPHGPAKICRNAGTVIIRDMIESGPAQNIVHVCGSEAAQPWFTDRRHEMRPFFHQFPAVPVVIFNGFPVIEYNFSIRYGRNEA